MATRLVHGVYVPADVGEQPFRPALEPARARGLKRSIENAHTVSCPADAPDLAWIVRFKLPFSWAASKNSTYGRAATRHKRPFLRAAARGYRDAITLLTRQAMKGIDLKQDKLWIDIFVEKPQNKGDAVNVLDLVCDGIKAAIPLDDRWYSIRCLDWSINKVNPHLFIGLAQEVGASNSKACSYCGTIKELHEFTNDRKGRQGRGNICVECRAPSYAKGPNKKYRVPA
jgi:uncharacterized Zn-finger protein